MYSTVFGHQTLRYSNELDSVTIKTRKYSKKKKKNLAEKRFRKWKVVLKNAHI